MIKAINPFTTLTVQPNDSLHRTISRAVYRLCELTGDDEWIVRKIKPLAELNLKRPLQPREVENLVKMHRERQENPCQISSRPRPVKNPAFTKTIASKANLEALRRHSGLIPKTGNEALARLYAPTDWLFIGSQMWDVRAREVAEWTELDLSRCSMIMPNPFEPEPPARKKEFVRERLFMIYESDEPWMTHDMQAGVIMHLRKLMPLRMVVSSGNSSLHAWFDVSTSSPSTIEEFEDTCLLLSGDPATTGLNHLVRLPWGTHQKTKNRQQVIYFR